MSLTTILSEIWRFIKNNFLKIISGALIIGVLAVLGSLFLPNLIEQPSEEISEEFTQTTPSEDAKESREYLTHIYEQEPAEFELFIQLEDGNIFGNSFIFDEYFTSPAVVEEIERESGVDYSQTLAHENNLGLYKTSRYRGSIAGIRDTSSNVLNIRVQAAETSEDNLILAETFANQILNTEIPFVENLSITIISEPEIGEKLLEDDLEMVSSSEALGMIAPTESENRSILLYAIAGFILGLLLTATVLFIIQLFKNKIKYAFQYSWDFSDYHFIFTTDEENKKLRDFLSAPEISTQIIVYQESSFVEQFIGANPKIKTTKSLSRFTTNSTKIDEIILFVETKTTDKDWYNEQYRLAEKYDSQVTIIQAIN